jgi:hypothetical protein
MGVAIILATYGDSAAAVRAGAGLAERLGEVDGDRSSLMIASIGQFLGWYQAGEGAGFIASVIMAIILLVIYGKVRGGSS